MEENMARHWGREKVYVQAFRITSLCNIIINQRLHIMLLLRLNLYQLTIDMLHWFVLMPQVTVAEQKKRRAF
jgi:hypothetical protein